MSGMFREAAFALIACVLLWAPARPQSPSAPEVATRDAPATFQTGVNLVMVPVVVRDSHGRAIGNLKQEDFQLLDKGKLQVITKFAVEKPGTPTIVAVPASDPDAPTPAPAVPTPAIPERFVAYLFDDVHLPIGDLLRVRAAAAHHLSELESTTRAAIFTTSGRATLDFTDDHAKLQETLNRIQPWTSAVSATSDCPEITFYMADLIVNKNDQQALGAGTAEAMVCNPPPPGVDPSTWAKQLESLVRATAQRSLSVGGEETRLALNVLRDVVRRMSVMPGSRTVILASPGFLLTIDHRPDETDLMDRAIRSNVTISSLDARGLYNPALEVDASRPSLPAGLSTIRSQYEMQTASAQEDVLAELADATGGQFFHNDNDLGSGFRRVAAQPEYLYVLGFSPQNLKFDGSYHALKVSLKNSNGLTLQARRGYYAPKHAVDPEEQAKEDIREALFSRDEMHDIPVDLNMQFFKSSAVNAKLSVLARVDVKHLRYRKVADRNDNTVTVVSGIFDRNGNFVSGIEKIVEMRWKDQTLESLPASGINVRTTFDLPSGSYVVRLVVRDSEGQTMAARNGAVQIP
jgi:VWFA-related protein